MQPKNPIPLDYRHAVRWLSWRAGYQDYLLEKPQAFASAYHEWNRLIDVSTIRSTFQAAQESAIGCLEGEETLAEVIVPFNDFRDGVCEVANRLANRQFIVVDHPDVAAAPEFWQMSGSELELIFAIYMNNVTVDADLRATNHPYAMSRVELYFATYYESNPLERWECDHDPVA